MEKASASFKTCKNTLSDAYQFVRNMGLRYIAFRIFYEFQKRTGILKLRFPVSLPEKQFVPLKVWQDQPVRFFFKDKFSISSFHRHSDNHTELLKRVEFFRQKQILFFGCKWYTVTNWLTNPDNGFQYDITKHWSEISDFSAVAGDIKYVWEKARFSFLYDLIRYDHYFQKDQSGIIFKEIEDWINENPVNLGPHWRCSQEISLRVLNWTYALHYYKTSPQLTERLFAKIVNSIYQQMSHVADNISFSRIAVRNNHALTETLSLYLVGILFPFFRESKLWRKKGKKWFEQEIAYQIYDDGTFLQFSMNYHRVVVQLLTWGIRIAHLNHDKWAEVIYDRAEKSLHFLLSCQDRETGQLPNYGNNDGALFFPLTECHFRDFRPQLSALAAVLGKTTGYEKGIWDEEKVWFGLKGDDHQKKTVEPAHKVFTFPKGGYYVLRDDVTTTFLRCGSYLNRPFQSDNLHLDIWVRGKNVLKDAGSYRYNTDKKSTAYFSGTASHNTVMLGDYDQMRKGRRFIWFNWIRKSGGEWKSGKDENVFDGWFEGFTVLGKSIIHRRKVTKQTGRSCWIVEDRIENAPTGILMHQIWHPCETFFEDFDIEASLENGEKLEFVRTEGWYSGSYGEKEPALRIIYSTTQRYIKARICLKTN